MSKNLSDTLLLMKMHQISQFASFYLKNMNADRKKFEIDINHLF